MHKKTSMIVNFVFDNLYKTILTWDILKFNSECVITC